jgi:hypothetical protein
MYAVNVNNTTCNERRKLMDINEKAKIRIEHWLKHNHSHIEEYEAFASELDSAGKEESAWYIREMAALVARSNEKLEKALQKLG